MWILITAILVSGFFSVYLVRLKKENEELKNNTTEFFDVKEEMQLALLLGLYHRYKKEEDPEKEENPLMFERFVAKLMENYYTGTTFVTQSSGDYGVDIEHERQEGLFLGQVKCYAPNNPVNYEPIAIIHSQMVKQKAVGGFVVTTSRFTPNAVRYADELNIELIDGLKLINMWTEGTSKRFKDLITSEAIEEKVN